MPKEFNTKDERERYIAQFVTEMWRRTESETKPDRDRWTLAFNLFQGKQSWSDREEWQSTPFVHVLSKIVRRMADTLSGLIFEKEDFFAIESKNKDNLGNVELARIFEKVVRYHLDRLGLPTLTYDFFIAGGISGLGLMKLTVEPRVVWRGEVVIEELDKQVEKDKKKIDPQARDALDIPGDAAAIERLILEDIQDFTGEALSPQARLERKITPKKRFEFGIKAEVVDPRNFGTEPDASRVKDSGYTVERFNRRFYELEPLFSSGVLDKKKRDDLLSTGHSPNIVGQGTVSTYETQKIMTKDQHPQATAHVPVVELVEYFGPLLGEDGRVIEENQHFIVGAGKVVLKDQKNPYWNQKPPYLHAIFSRSPFKAHGEGVADNSIDQQLLTNDLFATFMDMMKLAVYPPYVVDMNAVQNNEDVEEGLFPGMRIDSFGKDAKEIFSQIQYDTNVANVLFQTLSRLEQQAFSAAGVDVTSANQASRARITAAEIQTNAGRSDESVLALGRELDENFLIPLVQNLIDITLQFGFERSNLEQFRIQGVLTDSEFELVSNIPKLERYNEIKQNFKISVKGFRDRLERQLMLQNIVDLLGLTKNMPQNAIDKINWSNALADSIEAFGFDPNRWIFQNTPQDTAREENALLITDKPIAVIDQDFDQAHLPVHYEALVSSPNEALAQHVMTHLQRILQRGEPEPEIPDEVRQVLGLPPKEQPGIRQIVPGPNGAQ